MNPIQIKPKRQSNIKLIIIELKNENIISIINPRNTLKIEPTNTISSLKSFIKSFILFSDKEGIFKFRNQQNIFLRNENIIEFEILLIFLLKIFKVKFFLLLDCLNE